MGVMDVDLHIDSLILEGFALTDDEGRRVGESLRAELTRLLTDQGIPAALVAGQAIAHLEAEAFDLWRGISPEELGIQIARGLYDSL